MAKLGVRAVLLLIVLGGCSGLSEARVPLSPPGSEPYDQRLLGSWFSEQEESNKIFYIHLKSRSEPNMLDGTGILMEIGDSEFDETDAADIVWSTAIVHASKLDESTYYNIRRLIGIGDDYGASEDKKGYIIAKADLIDDQVLKLCLMKWFNVDSAIERSDIKGTLVEENESKTLSSNTIIWIPRERNWSNLSETTGMEICLMTACSFKS
jgi:hypothetical protein